MSHGRCAPLAPWRSCRLADTVSFKMISPFVNAVGLCRFTEYESFGVGRSLTDLTDSGGRGEQRRNHANFSFIFIFNNICDSITGTFASRYRCVSSCLTRTQRGNSWHRRMS